MTQRKTKKISGSTWSTDRKDLIEAVRTMPAPKLRILARKFYGSRVNNSYGAACLANMVMRGVLDSTIPETELNA